MSPAQLQTEIDRRRTFAIISHPDAGKTTLTEKLLLYGGAIREAGAVKVKKNDKTTTSDWMELEKKRGISISSSVLQFDYCGNKINLLDTPGHKDFSEDTYRTLNAADAAVMLIDAAKGVEPQTIKLFEVCRLRGIPIFTFVNKLDRPGREPLELLDEIEKVLGIRSCPVSWPIGSGDRFVGIYNRLTQDVLLYDDTEEANAKKALQSVKIDGIRDPRFKEILAQKLDEHDAEEIFETLEAELELVEVAGDEYDSDRVLAGNLSPVFFGSALNNFGVQYFLEEFIERAPAPSGRDTDEAGKILPSDERFSGFIFKIQANMDPAHRDRVAFMRVNSGRFEKGIQVLHSRQGKQIKLSKPFNFFGQDRVIVEEAWPGDIIGLLDTSGDLRLGDTFVEGKKKFKYEGVHRFSPEHFAQVQIKDPMKRKQLQKGLDQLSEEGVIQIYRQRNLGDKDPILAAVGILQFEVLKHRLELEYGVEVKVVNLPYTIARWASGQGLDPDVFERREDSRCLLDRDDQAVVLFKTEWALRWAQDNHKDIEFTLTSPF